MKFEIVEPADGDAPGGGMLNAAAAADDAPAASGASDDAEGTADDPVALLRAGSADMVASFTAEAESISESMAEIAAIAGRASAAQARRPSHSPEHAEQPPDSFRAARFGGSARDGRTAGPVPPADKQENGGRLT